MAQITGGQSGAGDSLKSSNPDSGYGGSMGGDMGEEKQSGPAGGNSFFIPSDVCEGMDYKPGDTIELQVIGKDEDGDLEVKLASEGKSTDWRDELRSELDRTGQSEQEGSNQ